MRPKLAIIGASYLQLPLVLKAKELNIEVHCFAWEDGAVCKDTADYFYPISIVEKEKILDICKEIGIDGICTIASDVAAPTVAYVASSMGLSGNSYECSIRANNKYLMRKAFSEDGVLCPQFKMVKSFSELDANSLLYPIIVKPSDRSGSMGVQKINSPDFLESAVNTALQLSFAGEAMIEEYIEGREISVEFISFKGKHYPLQITDKVTTGAPHFVELEHHQPSSLPQEMYSYIYNITNKALNSLGITDGASHSEYKITSDNRVYIMEIGARMGGDFIGSDLVKLSTGYDFLKGVIDVALGKFNKPDIKQCGYSGVYFLCKETEKLLPTFYDIENGDIPSDIVRYYKNDGELKNVSKSSDRSGYIIYKSSQKICL